MMDRADKRNVFMHPSGEVRTDWVVREEPLEIRVEGKPVAVTMRTPGNDEELAAGFLYTEGVVDGADDFQALREVPSVHALPSNTIDCLLAGGAQAHLDALSRATRELYATSSCGICGKASIDRIVVQTGPLTSPRRAPEHLLCSLPQRMRREQQTFQHTGGLHAAALFRFDGTLIVLREDIGRHNAVDKVIGNRLLADEVPLEDTLLVVTSRAGFEIVQKAAVSRIPVVVAIGAASTLAIDLAIKMGISLYGFTTEHRFNRYSSADSP